MTILPLILLALIQGLTEFLPVSSSGHLVLFHSLSGDADAIWSDSLVLDVAVHVGTLLSVIVYFWRDVLDILKRPFGVLSKQLVIGSIPVIIAGFVLFSIKPDFLRSLEIMAWMTIIFGIVLGIADRMKPSDKTVSDMTVKSAFIIGLFQILALVPGVSRSGITMTAGRFLGFTPAAAAKFSLLLSIIAIAGAGALAGGDLYESQNVTLGLDALLAAAFAFAAGLASIAVMMRWLDRHGFMPFVIYRVILGAVLLGFIYSGIVPV